MGVEKIYYVDANDILASVGGFWSSISSIGFVLLNYFLYRAFIRSESRHIAAAKLSDGDKEQADDDLREIEAKLKARLSFSSLFTLHDNVQV